jgi:beta-phosphoglucomutase-like phosphatase (HAD superfamily)
VLVDSEWLASRVEAELLRELGLDLSVEQVHELFLGKTVVACWTSSRRVAVHRCHPSSPTTGLRHGRAFMRELQPIPFVRAAVDQLRAARPQAGGGIAIAAGARAPVARSDRARRILRRPLYVTTMVARPSPRRMSIYWRRRGWARRRPTAW